MKEVAKLYGFEDVEKFAQYLISRAREERLSIEIRVQENACEFSIEPLENRVYLCPHYGQTREK